jgi:hypothetical protein
MKWIPFLPKGEDLSRWMSVASHLFQLVHFGTFFPSFWVPDLQGHFEALNSVFRDRPSQKKSLMDCLKNFIPRLDLSNGLSCAQNRNRMQKLRP